MAEDAEDGEVEGVQAVVELALGWQEPVLGRPTEQLLRWNNSAERLPGMEKAWSAWSRLCDFAKACSVSAGIWLVRLACTGEACSA